VELGMGLMVKFLKVAKKFLFLSLVLDFCEKKFKKKRRKKALLKQ
jgi:hypothetical protein